MNSLVINFTVGMEIVTYKETMKKGCKFVTIRQDH